MRTDFLEKGEVDTLDYPFILCHARDDHDDTQTIAVDSFQEFGSSVQATCLTSDFEEVPDRFEGGTFELVTDDRCEFTQVEPVMCGGGRVLFEG